MAITSTFTLTLSDFAAVAAIFGSIAGLLGLYIRLFVAAEMVRQENRIVEKVRLQFAEKSITDLQMREIQKDVEELKKVDGT